jgi:hypothetical protein
MRIAIKHVPSPTSWRMRSTSRRASFYPSLYANVAEVYLRLGNVAEARRYCAHAAAVADRLPGDTYGYIIRGLIARIQQSME